uniref:Guanylate kinase-like domain-containing protein n=1 Tax=Haemonchus contortus TaxID=6289 RepID=A0A7I4YEU0_HAECO
MLDSEILSDHVYEVFRSDRKLRKGGGVCCLAKDVEKLERNAVTSNRLRGNLLNCEIPFIVPLVSDEVSTSIRKRLRRSGLAILYVPPCNLKHRLVRNRLYDRSRTPLTVWSAQPAREAAVQPR